MALRRATASAMVGLLLVSSAGFVSPQPAFAAESVAATDVQAGEWWLDKLNIRQAWAASKQGDGVKVGVLDSGVDGSQADLRGAVTGGKDFSGGLGSANGQKPIGEVEGLFNRSHGSAMAGFIAGRGHGTGNKQGMLGVAPKADIVTASIGPNPQGTSEPAIRWLVDQGVKVINVSLDANTISAADLAYAQSKDVVMVAASGNDGYRTIGPPALNPGVVAVSGFDQDLASDSRSAYAKPVFPAGNLNAPPSTISGGIAVAGPFADEESDDPADGMVTLSLGGYTRTYGTSNSTAVVSGIVALIRAAHPEMNANDTINRLVRTARQVNPKGVGISVALGFGVPDAYAAVTKDFDATCENILGSLAAPTSNGVWPSVYTNKPYTPKCTSAATSSGASSSPSGSQSSSNAALPPASSDSSSGVPVWVWPVIAVVVLAVIGGAVLTRRSRRAGGAVTPSAGRSR